MKVTVHRDQVFALVDMLLERWQSTPKQHPFNLRDAVIPQVVIPPSLRNNKHELACFYFYVCIYMRGGIESLQAFNAMLRMRDAHPDLFKPIYAQWLSALQVQEILKEFVGWDSRQASIHWVENSRRLARKWKGEPLRLIKGLRDYDEALRRIKNKRTKTELAKAGEDGAGFMGFQPKMVSMFLYFMDWEKLLNPRFLYPAPADFHNYRIGLATGAIEVDTAAGQVIRYSEKISAPWREALMAYLKIRRADPVAVADVLWLFSLTMCGNSPATITKEEEDEQEEAMSTLFSNGHSGSFHGSATPELLRGYQKTCLVCPLATKCRFGIPARPYYRKGVLVLRDRLRVEQLVGRTFPPPKTGAGSPVMQYLLELDQPE